MIKRIKHHTSALAAIILVTCLQPAYGETADEQQEELKEYDVELIIFEDAHARYMYSESWQQKDELTDQDMLEGAIQEENIQGQAIQLPETTPAERTLTEQERALSPLPVAILDKEYRRLGLSSEVNVLYRTAWRQVGLDEDKAYRISLDELKNTHKSTSNNSISGSFRLVLARYLHFYAELDYHRPLASPEELSPEQVAAAITDFRFDAYRKMRSKELHYIDHPLIGILIKIMPVEKPEEAETPQT